MPELTCPNCQTPKGRWIEDKGRGYRIDNHAYCSRDCSDGATKSIREQGLINHTSDALVEYGHRPETHWNDGQPEGKTRKYNAEVTADAIKSTADKLSHSNRLRTIAGITVLNNNHNEFAEDVELLQPPS